MPSRNVSSGSRMATLTPSGKRISVVGWQLFLGITMSFLHIFCLEGPRLQNDLDIEILVLTL